jgi:hypothetical protein
MLRAADHLQYSGEDDLESSARLLYDNAVEMAETLDRNYQNSFPGNAEAADRVLTDTEPDPVLGLVANLSAAWDRLGESLKETTLFEAHPLVDNARRDIDAALAKLQATPPTTLAGARVAIEWLVEYDRHNAPETSGQYLRTLIRSPIFAQEEARS